MDDNWQFLKNKDHEKIHNGCFKIRNESTKKGNNDQYKLFATKEDAYFFEALWSELIKNILHNKEMPSSFDYQYVC